MKRLNPETGNLFKYGDVREDGYVFVAYRGSRKPQKSGYFDEDWYHPEKFKLDKVRRDQISRKNVATKFGHLSKYLNGARNRAKAKKLPFDIDLEYLKSLATDDCPVFKTKFNWGVDGKGHSPDRPSLDRVIPELGYVKGNVVFISEVANRIKTNATEVELYLVADWLHGKRKEVLNAEKKSTARLPKQGSGNSKITPKHRTVHGTGDRQNRNNLNYHCGTVSGQDFSYSAVENSSNSLVGRGKEVGTSQIIKSLENYGKSNAKT